MEKFKDDFKFDGDDAAWLEFMKAAMPIAAKFWGSDVGGSYRDEFIKDAAVLADAALAEWNRRRGTRTPL